MIEPLLEELLTTFAKGGFVSPPLIGATLALWYALGYRWLALRRGRTEPLRELVSLAWQDQLGEARGIIDRAVAIGVQRAREGHKHLQHQLDEVFAPLELELTHYATLIKVTVALAPLAGLLGTVIGMIETFDSLASMALYSRSGGIAGGVAQALFTTQLGLAVAIPGLILGRLLAARQRRLNTELDELRELLCGGVA